MTEQLQLSSTPARETVPAQHVQVGDFTTITGYRQVVRVDLFPRRREVRLWWRRGHRTFGYDTPLKVSRP